ARQEIGDRRTIAFLPDVGSAQAMASALTSIGITSRWVASDLKNRKEIISAFRRGEFQVLTNFGIAVEGFDCPECSAVLLCRPTKSRTTFGQMCGRPIRLFPGKSNGLIVDFDWLAGKHQLVQPVELFDTSGTDDEVMEIAKEFSRKRPRADILEV